MKKFAILSMLFALCACSFRSPQSQFYVMNNNDLNVVSEKSFSVAVAPVKVPDLLNRAQMVVYDKDSSEVQILEFHRWAEVLPDVLQTTLTNDLMIYLPKAYIERGNFADSTAQYSVNVEINRIEAYREDKVVLSAWWNIKDKNGKIIKRMQGSYTAPVEGKNIADLVNAESNAVHQMSREIAEVLAALR